MKLRVRKLNQYGFDHMVGLAAFVVLFAGIGTYLVVASHAATPISYVELKLNGNNVCFTGTNIATCSTSNREMLYIKPTGSNFQLRDADNFCVDDWNHAYQTKTVARGGTRILARLNTCYSNDKNQQWSLKGAELANAGNNYQGCLNSAGAVTTDNNPVIVYACNGSWNENWTAASATLNTSTTPTAPTWTLIGTGTNTKKSQTTVTFTNTIKNIGTKATGSFKYGPRVFQSTTANPVMSTNGTYAGEEVAGKDATYSGLKAGSSYSFSQPVVVPQSITSGYMCETVMFTPRTSTGLTNGRSPATCISIATLRQ